MQNSPDTNGEHIQHRATLKPAQQHDKPDYTEGIERELCAENVHRLLEGGLRCFLCLHHFEHLAKLGLFARVYHHTLRGEIT